MDKTQPIPYIHIFAIISALKQICDHPAVFHKQSGKWELFTELLDEARGSQQKVVVFTQYLAMLDIFGLYLKEQGIAYATIRGASTNRGNCEVFIAL